MCSQLERDALNAFFSFFYIENISSFSGVTVYPLSVTALSAHLKKKLLVDKEI